MVDRRTFFGAIAGLALGGCVVQSTSPAKEVGKRQIFVLVHGAWHGGWCWRDVARLLRVQGHRVFTPTLTGLGERVHLHSPDVNLSTHTQDIVNLIDFEDLKEVILVGHSYAGYIVTLVADARKDRLKHIVYLDAALPNEGKPFTPKSQREGIVAKYGESYSVPASNFDFLGIPEDHPKAEWVKRKLTPHPLGTFFEPVIFKNGGAKGVQKTFIRCTGNPRHKSGDPVIALAKDNPEWIYTLIETGHDAMITEPEKLSTMLVDKSIIG